MIVKRLREKQNWSQEQLAVMSGLSPRTIQRIESGNKASLESLKALTSVFEIDISALQEEIIVINKTSAQWTKEPLLVRFATPAFFFLAYVISNMKHYIDTRKHW